MIVYFGSEEVEAALRDYLADPRGHHPRWPAMSTRSSLSTQRKRIGVKAVENLVKKYAKIVTPLKKITPHKLRSTYGTALVSGNR